MSEKTNKIIGWVLTALVGAVLLFSTSGKFFMQEMQDSLTRYGLERMITIIGLGELISTILFLIPKTNKYGVLLLSAHMGGAIVIHMSHSEPYTVQAVVLVLIWAAGHFRNPGWLFSTNHL